MLIGFNNDVEYRGKTFHIQTEDHGEGDPRIETQLFFSGAILDTVITSYEETLENYEGAEAEERIRAQMKASHRSLYKKLMAGEYDEFAGLEPAEDEVEEPEAHPDSFTPSQDRVPAAAARVEEKGEDAILEFQKKKAKNHVSLDKLKSQLSKLDDSADEESEADDEVMPTQVVETSEADLDFVAAGDDDADEQPAAPPEPPKQAVSAPAAKATPALVDYEKTGANAWEGCEPPNDPLSLTELVEEFLGL